MRHVKLLMGLTAVALLLGTVVAAQCPTAAMPTPASPRESLAAYATTKPGEAPAPTKAPPTQPTPAAGAYPAASGAGGAAASSAPAIQPMIIKNATLVLVVPDVQGSVDSLTRIAASAGGYISKSYTQKKDDLLYATVVMRVPVNTFEATLERTRGLAKLIKSDRVEGTDVTGEYVDLESRLKHLEAYEQELLIIMKEIREKSDKAEEVLKIYDRVTAVQAEIETVKGRMKYLSDQAAFSTITIDLEPEIPPTPTPTPAPTPTPVAWRPDKTLDNATSSWVILLQRLADLGIWLSVYSTCLIPIVLVAGVALLIIWAIRRRPAKKTA